MTILPTGQWVVSHLLMLSLATVTLRRSTDQEGRQSTYQLAIKMKLLSGNGDSWGTLRTNRGKHQKSRGEKCKVWRGLVTHIMAHQGLSWHAPMSPRDETDRQTDRQTLWQSALDRETYTQTDNATSRQTHKHTCKHRSSMIHCHEPEQETHKHSKQTNRQTNSCRLTRELAIQTEVLLHLTNHQVPLTAICNHFYWD